ncbi:DUF742 domain-containing protein [Kitasatospora sp. NPDC048540]|uniref:DUF742 domain-containing protein n=1 Tax=Kitasatospora sp. NPDC048540 TaxID=3155634 RepID=UPI0033DC20F0
MSREGHHGDRALVRPYVVTGGRAVPSRNTYDHLTLVQPTDLDPPVAGLTPEHRAILALIRPGALAMADISAHLRLPFSVLCVLVSDLHDSGHVNVRAPVPAALLQPQRLLEAVLAGLRRL